MSCVGAADCDIHANDLNSLGDIKSNTCVRECTPSMIENRLWIGGRGLNYYLENKIMHSAFVSDVENQEYNGMKYQYLKNRGCPHQWD